VLVLLLVHTGVLLLLVCILRHTNAKKLMEKVTASVTFILNPSDAVRRDETRKFQVEV
jgi:hypothetical protein